MSNSKGCCYSTGKKPLRKPAPSSLMLPSFWNVDSKMEFPWCKPCSAPICSPLCSAYGIQKGWVNASTPSRHDGMLDSHLQCPIFQIKSPRQLQEVHPYKCTHAEYLYSPMYVFECGCMWVSVRAYARVRKLNVRSVEGVERPSRQARCFPFPPLSPSLCLLRFPPPPPPPPHPPPRCREAYSELRQSKP
jgi:hypothetical protein